MAATIQKDTTTQAGNSGAPVSNVTLTLTTNGTMTYNRTTYTP